MFSTFGGHCNVAYYKSARMIHWATVGFSVCSIVAATAERQFFMLLQAFDALPQFLILQQTFDASQQLMMLVVYCSRHLMLHQMFLSAFLGLIIFQGGLCWDHYMQMLVSISPFLHFSLIHITSSAFAQIRYQMFFVVEKTISKLSV